MINKHTVRTRLAAVAIAAAAFSLAGCGQITPIAGGESGGGDTTASNAYPAEVRDNFIESCVAAGGTEDTCGVCFEAVEAEFTFDEFVELDAQIGAGTADEETTARLESIIASCS
ncbi:hypothetical protein ACFQZV_06315 [Microbacterium koreense]|uniref:Uncharacterized protein n=1 Tax=Microbacterium koreense TaxID=323761 RepID=A0ABW2ZQU0_9MICO